MKRIKAACLHQILHFSVKDELTREQMIPVVDAEVEQYKRRLEQIGTGFKILREERQEDGTVILEIKKQYNTSPVGDFLQ